MKISRKKTRSKSANARRSRATPAAAPVRVAPAVVPAPVVAPAIPPSAPAPVPAAAPAGRQVRVVLGTSCTIQEAGAVRAHMLAQAAQPGPYEIDGASVEQIDTAGL